MKVYVVGPLYDPHEQRFVDALVKRIAQEGFEVSRACVHYDPARFVDSSDVFETDWETLRMSDVLVAILDGEQVDDATAAEMGIFFGMMQNDSAKKGILGLSTDIRTDRRVESEGKGLNLFLNGMLKRSGAWYQDVEQLVLHLRALGGDEKARESLRTAGQKETCGWF